MATHWFFDCLAKLQIARPSLSLGHDLIVYLRNNEQFVEIPLQEEKLPNEHEMNQGATI